MCCQRWNPSLCTCQMHAPPLNYKFPKLLRMLNCWSYPRPRKPDVSCCYVLLLIKTRGKVTHAQCWWNFLFQILLIHSWLNPCCGAYRGVAGSTLGWHFLTPPTQFCPISFRKAAVGADLRWSSLTCTSKCWYHASSCLPGWKQALWPVFQPTEYGKSCHVPFSLSTQECPSEKTITLRRCSS